MSQPHTFTSLTRNPVHFLAFGLGSGLIRPAPGTWGTLAGLLLYIPLASILQHPVIIILFLLITFALGCWLCDKTARDIGVHDFGGIVWDEFVGIWLTLALTPPVLFAHSIWLAYGAAFIAFRLFDIIKPPPIRQLDRRIPGGVGIMIDDVLAALFAAASLWLLALIIY